MSHASASWVSAEIRNGELRLMLTMRRISHRTAPKMKKTVRQLYPLVNLTSPPPTCSPFAAWLRETELSSEPKLGVEGGKDFNSRVDSRLKSHEEVV